MIVPVNQPLTFEQLRLANVPRCEAPKPRGFGHLLGEWNPLEWAGAMAGEAGEATNQAKKLRRGEDIPPERIAREAADAVIYADLLCARLGIDLGEIVRTTFNDKSDQIGSDIKL